MKEWDSEKLQESTKVKMLLCVQRGGVTGAAQKSLTIDHMVWYGYAVFYQQTFSKTSPYCIRGHRGNRLPGLVIKDAP